MSPTETSELPGSAEHPAEALAYQRWAWSAWYARKSTAVVVTLAGRSHSLAPGAVGEGIEATPAPVATSPTPELKRRF
jgi:hypothetical protein